MLNKKSFTIASIAALVSVSGMSLISCGTAADEGEVSAENFTGEEVVAVTDAIGSGFAFDKKALGGATVASTVSSDLGVLAVDNEDGTYDVRFIAALTGYADLSAASFTRASYTNAKGKTVAEKITDVKYVYTSLIEGEDVKWAEALSTDYTCYMVYSVMNIPETDIFTALSVTFNATSTLADDPLATATQAANYYGIKGDETVGVDYVKSTEDAYYGSIFDGDEGQYFTQADDVYGFHVLDRSNTAGECVVAPYVATFEGCVATKLGTVKYSAYASSSYGSFEGASKVTGVKLPDTIAYIGKWAFNSTSVMTHLELPAGLKGLHYNSISSCGATVLTYNAKNLTSTKDINRSGVAFETVNVGAGVESLPEKFFPSSKLPGKVVYDGTTAQWNALIEGKDNGFEDVEKTYCTDTKIADVVFHLDGGNLTADTDKEDDVYSVKVISGKKVADPGSPVYSDYLFDGWYADAEYTEAFSFDTAIVVPEEDETATVNIYAKKKDKPANHTIDGASALVLNADAGNYSLSVNVPTLYFSYTMPETATADRVYLASSNRLLNGSTTYTDTKITVYAADKTTALSVTSSFTPSSTSKAFGNGNKTYLKMNPGETYYFAVTTGSTLSGTSVYTFDLGLSDAVHDVEEEARTYTFGETQKVEINSNGMVDYWKFTAATSGTYMFKKSLVGATSGYDPYYLYHYDTEGNVVMDATLSSSTKVATVEITAGTTYYIFTSTSNLDTTDTVHSQFIIGDLPAGTAVTNAVSMTADGTVTTVTLDGFTKRYYSLAITENYDYTITTSGGTTSYAKTISIYDSEDTTTALSTVTEANSSGSSWSSSYGADCCLDIALNAGKTYIVEVGYSSTSGTTDFTIKANKLEAGDKKANAIALNATDGALAPTDVIGTAGGKWYSFLSSTTVSGLNQIYVTGNTGTVAMTIYCGTSTSVDVKGADIITNYFSANYQYYIYLTDTVSETLQLAITKPNADVITNSSTLAQGVTLDTVTLPVSKGNSLFSFTSGATEDFNTEFSFKTTAGTATFDVVVTSAGMTAGDASGSLTVGTEAASAGTVSGLLDKNKTYNLAISNLVMTDATASLTVDIAGVEIPPDGTDRTKAWTFDGDEDGYMDINVSSYNARWVKYTCTETGTYRVWSNKNGTNSDTYLYGIYEGDSTSYMAGTNFNDATSSGFTSADYTGYIEKNNYDFYTEQTFTAGTTYYISFRPGYYGCKFGILLKA
ncbi:MAG: InlB B-repeat-containing protein [Bacilli bacterium]